MKKAGYKVEHETMTIICSKLFLKKASKIGNPEYKVLLKAKHDNPNYTIEANEPKKAVDKMSTKGLTREFMELYILQEFGEDSQQYTDYQAMKNLCNDTKNSYMAMRTWFTTKYPDWDGKQAQRDEKKRQKDNEKQHQAALKLKSLKKPATDNQQDEEKT